MARPPTQGPCRPCSEVSSGLGLSFPLPSPQSLTFVRFQLSGPSGLTVQAPRVQGAQEAISAFKALCRVGRPAGDECRLLSEWKAPGYLVSTRTEETCREETGRPQKQSWRGATQSFGPRVGQCGLMPACDRRVPTQTCVWACPLLLGCSHLEP